MGQPTPGTTPVKFAPGVVNTDAIELNGVFTPDGREFFFTRLIDGVDTIYRSQFENGKWSDPQPLPLYAEPADARPRRGHGRVARRPGALLPRPERP